MAQENTGDEARARGRRRGVRDCAAAARPRVYVEEARGRRTLRVDGTYASVSVADRIATGSVWDALAAPILALPPERRRSVLILGLGGGTVARLARALAPRARIVGVEIDPAVIDAARQHFGLDTLGVETVQADAQAFLTSNRRQYDAVIEDVFVGAGRGVRKPDWLPVPGLDLAARRLAPEGVLVTNVIDEAPVAAGALLARFGRCTRITIDGYDNVIIAVTAGAGPGLAPRSLRAALAADPVLAPTLRKLRLRVLAATPPGNAARGC